MLSQAQRAAILELSAKGVSKHEIARVLKLSQVRHETGRKRAKPFRISSGNG
jgi:transcriptional regulator